jgi:hypothetical protein
MILFFKLSYYSHCSRSVRLDLHQKTLRYKSGDCFKLELPTIARGIGGMAEYRGIILVNIQVDSFP